MMEHSKGFSPKLCKIIGDENLRDALRSAIRRAAGYGFTNRGPVRLYVELMFLCGSAFDTDPQYVPLGQVLRASGDQAERAELIHQGSLAYLAEVAGPGNVNVRDALKKLSVFAKAPIPFMLETLPSDLLREMARMFPKKFAYAGEAGLKALIEEGITEAKKYQFIGVRQTTLIVVLKFAFGHGCTQDPLYPWILRTLRDEKIMTAAARAERLERKALTWLAHVLDRNEESFPA